MKKIYQYAILIFCIVLQMNVFAQGSAGKTWNSLARFAREEVLSYNIDLTNA